MNVVMDFIMSALPWVAIGLFVAVTIVKENAKKEGKELSKIFNIAYWTPALCFLFVSYMEMRSGKQSSANTWFILALVNVVLNFIDSQKK